MAADRLRCRILPGVFPPSPFSSIEQTIKGLAGDTEIRLEIHKKSEEDEDGYLEVIGLKRDGANALKETFGPHAEVIGVEIGKWEEDKWVYFRTTMTADEWKLEMSSKGKLMYWYTEHDKKVYTYRSDGKEELYAIKLPDIAELQG